MAFYPRILNGMSSIIPRSAVGRGGGRGGLEGGNCLPLKFERKVLPTPTLNFCKPIVLVKHMRNLVKDYLNVLYVHQNIHNRKKISQHHEYSYLFFHCNFFMIITFKWLLSSINSIISDLKWSKSKINYQLSEIR